VSQVAKKTQTCDHLRRTSLQTLQQQQTKQNKQTTYLPKYLPLRNTNQQQQQQKQGYQNQQTKQFVCTITLKEEVHPDHEPIFQNPLLLWEGESSKQEL
jgi:hypothetical protein